MDLCYSRQADEVEYYASDAEYARIGEEEHRLQPRPVPAIDGLTDETVMAAYQEIKRRWHASSSCIAMKNASARASIT
jgi:hypothetical protein